MTRVPVTGAGVRLEQTIPALPDRDAAAVVDVHRERLRLATLRHEWVAA